MLLENLTLELSYLQCTFFLCTDYESNLIFLVPPVILDKIIHTCLLLRNIQQLRYSVQTEQHEPCKGECCPVWAL